MRMPRDVKSAEKRYWEFYLLQWVCFYIESLILTILCSVIFNRSEDSAHLIFGKFVLHTEATTNGKLTKGRWRTYLEIPLTLMRMIWALKSINTRKNFSFITRQMSVQIFLLIGHFTDWTRNNLLTDKTVKKINQDVLVRCSIIVSDHNAKLADIFNTW